MTGGSLAIATRSQPKSATFPPQQCPLYYPLYSGPRTFHVRARTRYQVAPYRTLLSERSEDHCLEGLPTNSGTLQLLLLCGEAAVASVPRWRKESLQTSGPTVEQKRPCQQHTECASDSDPALLLGLHRHSQQV